MYQTFDDVSSVVPCCTMKSCITIHITHIHRHSFSQQPINRFDVTILRCINEALNKLLIGFSVWKMIACELKENNLVFVKLISTKLILIVFELLLQVKNKSFWLKINWTNTIFQEFRHANTIFIKQKWKEQKWSFCVINCQPFYQCGRFVSGILLLNMLNSNRERRKNTILCENILGKFISMKQKNNGQFAMLTVNNFANANALLLGFYC